jgi:hypothetical protein
MCPPTHLQNRDRYSLRSHRISYFSSLTARVYSYLGTNHRRHGGIYTLAHTRDVTHLNLTEFDFIQSLGLHTAGLHHLPAQWGGPINFVSIAVTRFVISSFTYHLTQLDLRTSDIASINFMKKNFFYDEDVCVTLASLLYTAHTHTDESSPHWLHCRIDWDFTALA